MQDFVFFVFYIKRHGKHELEKMMKGTFLLVLVGCWMCGEMKAQHQQVFDEFRQEVGDKAQIYAGKLEAGYPTTIYLNHPYWFFDDFSSGSVVFNGLEYKDVQLRYDAFLKQLVVNTPVSHSNVYVPMHQVEKFTMEGTEFGRRNGEVMAVLFSSPRMELVKFVDVVPEEKLIDNMKVMYEFKRSEKYYILCDGRTSEVSRLNSVLKLFPEWKKELKSFAKMHHLNFKEHCQSSLTSLVNYANQLLNQP